MGFIQLNYSGYGLYIMVKQYNYSAITIPFRLMVYTTHKNGEFGNGLWLCFNHSGIIVEKSGILVAMGLSYGRILWTHCY